MIFELGAEQDIHAQVSQRVQQSVLCDVFRGYSFDLAVSPCAPSNTITDICWTACARMGSPWFRGGLSRPTLLPGLFHSLGVTHCYVT